MITSPLLITIPGILHSFGTKDNFHTPHHLITLVTAKQVHGTEILYLNQAEPMDYVGFDILMTDQKGIAVAVKTADCLPILMVEPEIGVVAAVHAGWKGTLARVSEKAVQKILELGGKAENLAVAMGPCLGKNCLEVEKDVAVLFEKEFSLWPDTLRKKSEAKWLIDNPQINRLQLMRLGVRPERIDHIDLCNHCRPDLFWSYRTEGEKAGRMINFIQLIDMGNGFQRLRLPAPPIDKMLSEIEKGRNG